jgi:hypothetical protein
MFNMFCRDDLIVKKDILLLLFVLLPVHSFLPLPSQRIILIFLSFRTTLLVFGSNYVTLVLWFELWIFVASGFLNSQLRLSYNCSFFGWLRFYLRKLDLEVCRFSPFYRVIHHRVTCTDYGFLLRNLGTLHLYFTCIVSFFVKREKIVETVAILICFGVSIRLLKSSVEFECSPESTTSRLVLLIVLVLLGFSRQLLFPLSPITESLNFVFRFQKKHRLEALLFIMLMCLSTILYFVYQFKFVVCGNTMDTLQRVLSGGKAFLWLLNIAIRVWFACRSQEFLFLRYGCLRLWRWDDFVIASHADFYINIVFKSAIIQSITS